MRPRTIAIVGAAIVAAGLILQQLVMAGAASVDWMRGPELDQSLLGLWYAIADTIARIAVPLGSAVVGGGLVLWLAVRRPGSTSPEATIDEPERVPRTDPR